MQRVREILDSVDAAGQTRALIDIYFTRGLEALDSVGVDNEDQRNLRQLALFLVERSY